MKKVLEEQNVTPRGHYHVEVHEAITKFKNPIKSLFHWMYDSLDYKPLFLNRFMKLWCRGKLKRTYDYDNLIPTVGLAAIAAQFGKTTITKDIGDNLYIAVGSDATAPDAGDTILGPEVARKINGSRSAAGVVASIAVFFAATEATGTHREFGLFGDGDTTTASAAADSGILYSHVAANTTVSPTETLTITFELTIS